MTRRVNAQVWPPAKIRELILTNDKFLERSIVQIYERQTADEQNSQQTVEHNGVGFTGVDAQILSSFALQIRNPNWRGTEGGRLTNAQKEIARRKMVKYGRQLSEIAEVNYRKKLYDQYVGVLLPPCDECGGNGVSTDGLGPTRCETCHGSGVMR